MKRAGFTMIELIFVIVILGILAAVAIPKLAATRTDAQVSKMAANVATLVTDLGSYWTSKGTWGTNWGDMTNVPLTNTGGTTSYITTTTPYTTQAFLTNGTTASCYSFDLNTTNGVVTVTELGSTDAVCAGSYTATETSNLSASGTSKTHSFGSTGVVY
ncbi:prepilin-type N-terminal cleavage/methylation domain-containing protein [Sulfurimonas sp. HSL-1716]|uniref:type II secretion system protein n=1 Tax=Hydrocurvibacter sulfurireducens TaxID=3131937 RepID=UPI0031F83F57